jgi:orotate phosphoribosyltransferase
MMMTQDEILSIFKQTHALLEGHFQLTSGLHSAQYFQCAQVLQYPHYAEKLCRHIAEHFRLANPTLVIAPALGGIVVAQEVGRQLNTRTIFTERQNGIMQLRRGFAIDKNDNVLVCEDVITTGGSVQEVIDIVLKSGGTVIGVGAIVDRSNGKSSLKNLFAVMTMNVLTYQPTDCPLCRQNIPVEKPGSRTTHQTSTV